MPIKIRNKATGSTGPSSLEQGELAALLTANTLKLFVGDGSNVQTLLGAPVAVGGANNHTLRFDSATGTWVTNANFTVTAAGAVVAASTIQGTTITATTAFQGPHNSGSITGTTGDAYNALRLGGTLAAEFPTSDYDDIAKANTSATTLTFDNVSKISVQATVPVVADEEIITFVLP